MAQPSDDTLVGQTLLGKLRVERVIGRGGMGCVYEVVHKLTNHRRALKVLHGEFQRDPEIVARFVREAGVAGTLDSPHIVETFDAGQLDNGAPYVLMELLQGEPLSALMKREAPLEPARVVQLMRQVCEGVDAAHRRGIVHRDLKPDNIFICGGDDDLRVKILDFGISKFLGGPDLSDVESLTVAGAVIGTPWYMPTEQAQGHADVDERADVYALGVIMYQALSGQRPYTAENYVQLTLKIHQGEYTPLRHLVPYIHPELAAIVAVAMSQARTDRFANAYDLGAALSRCKWGEMPAEVAAAGKAAREAARKASGRTTGAAGDSGRKSSGSGEGRMSRPEVVRTSLPNGHPGIPVPLHRARVSSQSLAKNSVFPTLHDSASHPRHAMGHRASVDRVSMPQASKSSRQILLGNAAAQLTPQQQQLQLEHSARRLQDAIIEEISLISPSGLVSGTPQHTPAFGTESPQSADDLSGQLDTAPFVKVAQRRWAFAAFGLAGAIGAVALWVMFPSENLKAHKPVVAPPSGASVAVTQPLVAPVAPEPPKPDPEVSAPIPVRVVPLEEVVLISPAANRRRPRAESSVRTPVAVTPAAPVREVVRPDPVSHTPPVDRRDPVHEDRAARPASRTIDRDNPYGVDQ